MLGSVGRTMRWKSLLSLKDKGKRGFLHRKMGEGSAVRSLLLRENRQGIPSNFMKLTDKNIRAFTNFGGITAKQCDLLGFGWPPPHGWLKALIGKEMTEEKYAKLMEIRRDRNEGKKDRKPASDDYMRGYRDGIASVMKAAKLIQSEVPESQPLSSMVREIGSSSPQ